MSHSCRDTDTTLTTPVTVPNGGTGRNTLTDGAVLVGDGTNPVTMIGPLTDGQILIGDTAGVDPVAAVPTSSDGSITITGGAGTLDFTVSTFGVDEDQIFYVGKHGNDANSGLNIEEAFLTFGAAITAATAATPTANNRFVIKCFDDGIYTENITCVQYVDIDAVSASLVGTIVIVDNVSVKFRHQDVATGLTGISKTAGTLYSFIEIDDINLQGNAIGLICTAGFVNIKWKRLTVLNGVGIGDLSSALNHIHVNGGDIYITGTGVGIGRANAGTTVGRIDHIQDTGGGNGTGIAILDGEFDLIVNRIEGCSIGIDIDAGVANISAGNINCTTAYDVANGATLNLFCNDLTGAKTTVVGSIVYEVILGTAIEVIQGGTGAATLADHGILLGSGTAAITATVAPTNGQLLIGSTGADPALATLTAPAAGITITGGAGSITFALADDLSGLEALAGTGLVTRTVANTYTERTITGTANQIDVVNGDGVAGNPTLDFSDTPEMKQLTIDPGASGDSFVQFDINTTNEFIIGVDDDDGDAFKISVGGALGTNDAVEIDSNGILSYPLQSCFSAYNSQLDNVTGDGTNYTLVLANERFDQNSDFDGTSTFTAPVDGKYMLGYMIYLSGSNSTSVAMVIVTSNRSYSTRFMSSGAWPGSDQTQFTDSVLADMDAADTSTVTFTCSGGAKQTDLSAENTIFWGHKAC